MVHLMVAASLRDSQREATRDRIIAAVTELVAEDHPAAISVPAVARRSGVSIATIYRYFPNKQELLDAAATIGLAQTVQGIVSTHDDTSDYIEAIRAAFRTFATQVGLVRGQFATPIGRELRRTRRPEKQRRMQGIADAFGVRTDGANGARFLAVAEALSSSAMFLEFHDQLDLDADQAANYVAWALRVLAEETARVQEGEHDDDV
jgi:AcrR family transcriptional regulator